MDRSTNGKARMAKHGRATRSRQVRRPHPQIAEFLRPEPMSVRRPSFLDCSNPRCSPRIAECGCATGHCFTHDSAATPRRVRNGGTTFGGSGVMRASSSTPRHSASSRTQTATIKVMTEPRGPEIRPSPSLDPRGRKHFCCRASDWRGRPARARGAGCFPSVNATSSAQRPACSKGVRSNNLHASHETTEA